MAYLIYAKIAIVDESNREDPHIKPTNDTITKVYKRPYNQYCHPTYPHTTPPKNFFTTNPELPLRSTLPTPPQNLLRQFSTKSYSYQPRDPILQQRVVAQYHTALQNPTHAI